MVVVQDVGESEDRDMEKELWTLYTKLSEFLSLEPLAAELR